MEHYATHLITSTPITLNIMEFVHSIASNIFRVNSEPPKCFTESLFLAFNIPGLQLKDGAENIVLKNMIARKKKLTDLKENLVGPSSSRRVVTSASSSII